MLTSAVSHHETLMRVTESSSPLFPHLQSEDFNNWPTHITSEMLSETQNENHEQRSIQR